MMVWLWLCCSVCSARPGQLLFWALAVLFLCRDHRYQDSLAKGRRQGIEALMLLVKPPTKRFGFVDWGLSSVQVETLGPEVSNSTTELSWFSLRTTTKLTQILRSTLVLHNLGNGKPCGSLNPSLQQMVELVQQYVVPETTPQKSQTRLYCIIGDVTAIICCEMLADCSLLSARPPHPL